MDINTKDKLHLCFREIAICKKLLETKRLDDFTARLISIYVMVRADDITKMWSHSFLKSDIERVFTDNLKNNTYNGNFRQVRDMLGAHYQSPNKSKIDIFASSKLFRAPAFSNVISFIEDLIVVESIIENKEVNFESIDSICDLSTLMAVVDSLFADDKACITNSALDLFGINKGGMISGTDAQRKGQYLRGIELMIEYAYKFASQTYQDIVIARMFKRLLICVIYNYHDNLYTRKELNPEAAQYEEGFDMLYKHLLINETETQKLENVFEQYENKYNTDAYFRSNRLVRDKACGHFDERCSLDDINSILDGLEMTEVYSRYLEMLRLFNYICNNTFVLQMHRLPPRSFLNDDSRFVKVEGITNFYEDNKDGSAEIERLSPDEILRSLRKKDGNYERSRTQMKNMLFSLDDNIYGPMIGAIHNRLVDMKGDEEDLLDILLELKNAKRGDPNRLQISIFDMLGDVRINNTVRSNLLWVLSQTAIKSLDVRILNYINRLIVCKYYPIQCYGCLAYLHYIMSDRSSFVGGKYTPRDVDIDFKKALQNIKKPVSSLGIWLALNQNWMFSEDYAIYRKRESCYNAFFKEGLHKSLDAYIHFISLKEELLIQTLHKYESTDHYLLLLELLTTIEEERNQQPNLFLDLWNANCFIRFRGNLHEGLAVGLMTELSGDIDTAREILTYLIEVYPLSDDAQNTFNDFKKRHNL